MKKKLMCLAAAAAMVTAIGTAAVAANTAPTVFIDSRQIMFSDQEPMILGKGHTVVPARGVFEAMGAEVKWDADKRLVEIESADHTTIIKLTIDDNTMRVYDTSGMFASVLTTGSFEAPETLVTLEVAPQIMADTGRTMIPLRAISEALDADVQWDGDTRQITITTGKAPVSKNDLPSYTLSSSADTVEAGETVEIYIDAHNIPEGKFVSSVTAALKYDKDNFEFVDAQLVNGDEVVESAFGGTNTEFSDDCLKTNYLTIDFKAAAKTDGRVFKFTFRSINGEAGEFAISNSYHTQLGYNTSLLLDAVNEEGKSTGATMYKGDNLYIDTTPVWVNRAAE